MSFDVYGLVTEKILDALSRGVVPWQKPWDAQTHAPRNINGRRYHGINVILLTMAGYDSPYWLTFRQAKELGGNVRKGEHGTIIVFWRMVKSTKEKDDEGKPKVYPMLRYYRVFNAEQCDGIDVPTLPARVREYSPIDAADRIVAGFPNPPTIEHHGDSAHYRPMADTVTLPKPETFHTAEDYCATRFHELTHSTCHSSRLNRPIGSRFGSHEYGREELVAEMGSAFLCAESGITATHDNSAAYIASWIRTISEDIRAVVVAAGQAQKAADYIMGRTRAAEDEEDKAA